MTYRFIAPLIRATWTVALVQQSSFAALDRPPVVAEIERTFGDFFLFTTNGGGKYIVYQRIEDRSGVSQSDEIVCMPRECFLQIAEAPDAALGSGPARRIGTIRERFRAVRDAYGAMRSAAPELRASAVQAWRMAIVAVDQCLENQEAC
jgi:hypothetical protein